MWECIRHVIKPRGAVVLFGSQPFTSALVMSNPKWFKYELIWKKSHATGQLNLNVQPMREHENMLVFAQGKGTYNLQLTQKPKDKIRAPTRMGLSDCYGSQREYGRSIPVDMRAPTTVVEINSVNHGERGLHPTQKPVDLMAYLVKTYTNEGDTVLDFTSGSGSTGVACAETGRNFIGIELDPHYFAVASERIEAAYRKAQGMPRLGKASDLDGLPIFAT